MKFLHPEFFYYMLPPFVLFFALILTQKEAVGSYFSDEVMQKLRVATKGLTLKARNALFFLAGFFMIVALAEPVIVDGKIDVEQKSADILIGLDISNSMLANDVYPSRLELAKKKAVEFIRLVTQDRVGVVAFAKGSYLVSPLSFDKEAVAFLLQNLDTTSITEQGTDFMTLLETVKNSSKHSKRKYLLLFTDGGDKSDFTKEIEYAKENGITVFVLGVGTKRGAPIKMDGGTFMKYHGKIVITKLNEHIADLALGTGGVFIKATNSDKDIEAMYKEMSRVIEKKTLKTKSIEKHIPLFYIPLGAAMLLVLIALASMTKRTSVHVPSMFLLASLLFFGVSDAKAGVLDFMDIKEAKEAYAMQHYKEAAKRFEAYAKSSQKPYAYFDAGDAWYKAGKYKKALEMYDKVQTQDATLKAHTFHNKGNAYAKLGQYQKAIEAYEDALKLKDDKETRENLEVVKKLLEKKKKQQKQPQKKQTKQDKQQKDQKNKQQNSQKNKQNKENEKQSKNSQDAKGKGDKQQRQNKSKSESKSKQQNKNQNKRQKQQREKKENQKLQKLSDEQKKKDQNATKSTSMPKIEHKERRMSDAEEKKWLKELNKESRTFLYTIKPAQQNEQEAEDEKPW